MLLQERQPTELRVTSTRASPAEISCYLTLFNDYQTTPGTLCSVLVLVMKKVCGWAGEDPEEGQKDGQRNGKNDI